MSSFPKLKTAAVAQYPAGRRLEFSTGVVRFVDGSEQRYRDSGAPLRRWTIRLDLLDETELASLEEFFTGAAGAFGSFAFTDPWDGKQYGDCSLEGDSFETGLAGEMQGRTALVIQENRS